jgi:signal transduction histidine kinase
MICAALRSILFWFLYLYRKDAREDKIRSEERTRIARELHDSLLQSLYSLTFRLQAARNLLPERPAEAAETLDRALELADRAIAEGRETVSHLRTSTIVDRDLVTALQTVAERLSSDEPHESPPDFRVIVKGQPRILSEKLCNELYCIAREGLRNAFRHAQAHSIVLEIAYDRAKLHLCIRDDGSGIGSATIQDGRPGAHWGLCGMRERARTLGGELEVRSNRGSGTEVELTVRDSIAS